jgi:uroporphyrinogen-III synthase
LIKANDRAPTMRLMITRPKDDAAPLGERLSAQGHEVLLEPLLEIRFKADASVDLTRVNGVLATSANGVRALAHITERRDLRLFAVGDATARAARQAGFDDVLSAGGDVASLVSLVSETLDPTAGRLLHVAGTRLAGDLQGQLAGKGFEVERAVLYEARTAGNLTPVGRGALQAGAVDGVLLFSPRTARTFVDLAVEGNVAGACRDVTAYCLSPAVARRATERPNELSWRHVREAARPEEVSLLELLETSP